MTIHAKEGNADKESHTVSFEDTE